MHDSFGRPTSDAAFYSHAERIAFGMGDLHLPMGWGDIGWETILPELACRPGTVMIVELPPRFRESRSRASSQGLASPRASARSRRQQW